MIAEEILPIEFTFKCPETVHHVFWLNHEDYNNFYLPNFIYRGAKDFQIGW